MKIDRLLAITIYLLNHGITNAQKLADKFEVSKRTIQRDIETLNMAGIPVTAMLGSDGGYQILDTFKIENQLKGDNDYTYIIVALKGLISAYKNPNIEASLEKMIAQVHATKDSKGDNEHFWFATILALGNKIRILEPEELRQRVCKTCEEILSIY